MLPYPYTTVSKTVEVYRLWKDNKWDKVSITVDIPKGLEESEEFLESKAVEKAWLDLAMVEIGAKPLQIGLYMHSIYGVKS